MNTENQTEGAFGYAGGGVTTSPRPKPMPDRDKPKLVGSSVYGEYGEKIDMQPFSNPITRLGQTQGSDFKHVPLELTVGGVYLPPQEFGGVEYLGGPIKSDIGKWYEEAQPGRKPPEINSVTLVGKEGLNPQTAAHEFMHRGLNIIREDYPEEELSKLVDEDTAAIISRPDYEHFLVQAVLEKSGGESRNDYMSNLTENSKEKVRKAADALYGLAEKSAESRGYYVEKPHGPPKEPEEEGFFSGFLKSVGFAEGGMVEDDQMNRLMQKGGMADDGIAVEPVTGNEVPPGSLASEVRDDVDVKLSEGEYVVPADVVRFFGVKFFEDLRSQAKQGLSEMDSEGRIGGNAVTPEGVPVDNLDEELTPEEEQMLAEAMAMPGMAEGGVVTDNLERTSGSTFDRSQFTLGSPATGIESRKYINPTTKEERTFQFIGGMPLGIIPEGFVPWTADLAKKTEPEKPAEEVVKPTGEKGGSGKELGGDTGSGSDPYAGWAGENAAAISADPFGFGMEALGKTNADEEKKGLMGLVGGLLGGTVVGKIGGLIGDVKALDAISDAEVALSRLDPSSEQAKTLKDAIEDAIDNLDTGLLGKLADLDLVATGKQKMKAYEAYLNEVENPLSMSNVRQQVSSGTFDPKSYVSGYESRNEGRGGYFGSKEYSKGLSQTAASYSAAAKGDTSAIGPDYDPYSDASIWGNAEESSTSKGSGSAGGSKDWSGGGGKGTGATGATGAGAGVGLRAKGGLITRPKKPTSKKKKGLAS